MRYRSACIRCFIAALSSLMPLSAHAQAAPAAHKMEYWLGGTAPVIQRDRHKAIPADYNELFTQPEKFPLVGSRITGFGIATQFILRATPEEQQMTLNWVRERHLKLSGELGVVIQSPDPACGGFGEGRTGPATAAQVSRKMHDIGGQLDYLNMDEPVTFGHLSPQNKCPQTIPQLAEVAASRVGIYKTVFPAMKVNLIDAVGSRSPTLVHDEVLFVDLLGQQGVHIDYFIADVQWDSDWQPVFEQLAMKFHARGIKIGLTCNGSLKPKTDAEWERESVAHCKAVGEDPRINPDLMIIGSWSDLPTHMLPEDQPGTQTHIGRELMKLFP